MSRGGLLVDGDRVFALAVDEAEVGGHDAPRDDRTEDLSTVLRQRREEVSERIEQLHERGEQLSARLTRGSAPDEATDARTHAQQAHEHAQEAHEHAQEAHERVAEGHAEAAELHEHVAEVLAEHGRPDRAQAHREAAEQDRDPVGDEERAAVEERRREHAAEGE